MALLTVCEDGAGRQKQGQSNQNDHQGFHGFHVPSSFLNMASIRLFCPIRRAKVREVYTALLLH
jgi:hypothetical protein